MNIAITDAKLFSVVGVDAASFLQGQLTADVAALNPGEHLIAAHCSIKGSMVGLFRVMRISEECFWLRVHQEIAESAFNNLKKYSIFSKVELSFIEEAKGYCLSSEKLESLNSSEGSTSCAAQIDAGHFEFWTTDSGTQNRLSSDASTSVEAWHEINVRAGIFDLREATQEKFIPQMCNLQAIDGVSFSKGCYTGQEIVTRLQHRGILKKAMYGFNLPQGHTIGIGASLFNADNVDVGTVVLTGSTDQTYLLAVIQQSEKEGEIFTENGEALTAFALPYTLDPKLFESKR